VSSSRNREEHWKVETKVQLLKLTNIETCVVVAPPIVQKVNGMVEVGWEKMRNQFFFIHIESRRKKIMLCKMLVKWIDDKDKEGEPSHCHSRLKSCSA
jgi:hypothetical protein